MVFYLKNNFFNEVMNEYLISELEKVAFDEKYNGSFFKFKSYENALQQIINANNPIYSSVDLENFKINKNVIKHIETLLKPNDDIILDFLKIYGVGFKTAYRIIKLGITDFQKLKENQHLLNKEQRIGLKYYKELLEPIPYREMKIHERLCKTLLPVTFEFVGSYQREEEISENITILMTFDNFTSNKFYFYIGLLEKHKYIKEKLTTLSNKFVGIVSLPYLKPRKIIILYASRYQFPYYEFYYNNGVKYNRNIKEYCLKRGLKITEKGLYNIKTTKPIPLLQSSDEILEYLQLPKVKPKDRIDKVKKSE